MTGIANARMRRRRSFAVFSPRATIFSTRRSAAAANSSLPEWLGGSPLAIQRCSRSSATSGSSVPRSRHGERSPSSSRTRPTHVFRRTRHALLPVAFLAMDPFFASVLVAAVAVAVVVVLLRPLEPLDHVVIVEPDGLTHRHEGQAALAQVVDVSRAAAELLGEALLVEQARARATPPLELIAYGVAHERRELVDRDHHELDGTGIRLVTHRCTT